MALSHRTDQSMALGGRVNLQQKLDLMQNFMETLSFKSRWAYPSMLWSYDFSWIYGPLIKLVLINLVFLVCTNTQQLLVEFQQKLQRNLQFKGEDVCTLSMLLSNDFPGVVVL